MIYPFECQNCFTEFQIDLTVAEYSATKSFNCPLCSSKEVKRLFFSHGVHYKDSDFTKHVKDKHEQ